MPMRFYLAVSIALFTLFDEIDLIFLDIWRRRQRPSSGCVKKTRETQQLRVSRPIYVTELRQLKHCVKQLHQLKHCVKQLHQLKHCVKQLHQLKHCVKQLHQLKHCVKQLHKLKHCAKQLRQLKNCAK